MKKIRKIMEMKFFSVVVSARGREKCMGMVSPFYAGLPFSFNFCPSFSTNELRCSNLIAVINTKYS